MLNSKQKYLLEQALRAGLNPMLDANHPFPTTRREFLARGFVAGFGSIFAPSLLSLIADRAYGTECSAGKSTAFVAPFLHFEFTGGGGLAGNFVFGRQRASKSLEPIASYASLGLADGVAPGRVAPNAELGGPFHANSSILAGIKSVLSAGAIAKTVVVGGAGESMDDSAGNPYNGVQLAVQISKAQSNLVQIAGNLQSATGGRDVPLDVGNNPTLSKVRIVNLQSLKQVVDPGVLAQRLSRAEAEKVAKAAEKISNLHLSNFTRADLSEQQQTLVDCGYKGVAGILSQFDEANLTPANDTAFNNNLFNLNVAAEQSLAVITKLLLDGNAAGGSFFEDGFDYHGQGRQAQDTRDFAGGRHIGLALEAAHRKGKPLFIAVTTDGGVAASGRAGQDGKIEFTADSGQRGAYLMFAIGASTRPNINFFQIGAYQNNGSVDRSYLASAGSPRLQGLNIVQNYAAFIGATAAFQEALRRAGLTDPFEDKGFLAFTA